MAKKQNIIVPLSPADWEQCEPGGYARTLQKIYLGGNGRYSVEGMAIRFGLNVDELRVILRNVLNDSSK